MVNKARAKMGRIKHWYGGKKGYGFVRPEDGGKQYLCTTRVWRRTQDQSI